MVHYDLMSGEAKPIPYRINENYQPYLVSCEEEVNLLSRLHELSKAARSVGLKAWLSAEYRGWYAREFRVWKKRRAKTGSLALLLKFMIWLILPMQVWFYWYTIANLAKGSQVK